MVSEIMYKKIQKYKRKGKNKSEISRELKLDPHTVAKYYDMDHQEYKLYEKKRRERPKQFALYKDDILNIFKKADKKVTSSSIYDFLEEKYESLPANYQSLRNYINYLIKTKQVNIKKENRIYREVPQLPYGKQMQVDFGQYILPSGLKLYIFAAVLSSSRYKYIAFQNTPFTTSSTISHLLDSFDYFGGIPTELVIDQDKVMVVSENKGDIVYTKDFKYFINEMDLKMYVCRKADPESKGKVENLVKFVKQSFLSSRDFDNINEAKSSLSKWLIRRANGKISQATIKIPADEIEKERTYLRKIRKSIFRKDSSIDRDGRKVDGNSYISYSGSSYSVPIEYKGSTVEIYTTEDQIFIYDKINDKLIANHKLSLIDGKNITDSDHFRMKSTDLNDIKNEVFNKYDFPQWKELIGKIFKKHNRYVRDQSYELKRYFFSDIDEDKLKEAVIFCLDNKTYSAFNLYDTYKYYLNMEGENDILADVMPHIKKVSRYREEIKVEKHDLTIYKSLLNIIQGILL